MGKKLGKGWGWRGLHDTGIAHLALSPNESWFTFCSLAPPPPSSKLFSFFPHSLTSSFISHTWVLLFPGLVHSFSHTHSCLSSGAAWPLSPSLPALSPVLELEDVSPSFGAAADLCGGSTADRTPSLYPRNLQTNIFGILVLSTSSPSQATASLECPGSSFL